MLSIYFFLDKRRFDIFPVFLSGFVAGGAPVHVASLLQSARKQRPYKDEGARFAACCGERDW
jgi:hypothetical protein